jgi:hypothetical protein
MSALRIFDPYAFLADENRGITPGKTRMAVAHETETLAALAALAGGQTNTLISTPDTALVPPQTNLVDIIDVFVDGPDSTQNEGQTPIPAKAAKPAKALWPNAVEAEANGSDLRKALLLPDGRRMHWFRADDVPATAPDQAREVIDQARSFGAVLVADGNELIVVERWQSALPLEMFGSLGKYAGPIISIMRGESRARRKDIPSIRPGALP